MITKKGFTMVEMTIGMTIFSFVVIGMLVAISRIYSLAQFSKVEIMGVNLAREGVEELYNLRDTNRLKYSSQRDQCRLKKDPLGSSTCNSNEIFGFGSGLYILHTKTSSAGQMYFALSGTNIQINSGYDHFWQLSSGEQAQFEIQSKITENEIKFYRIVKIFGTYDKSKSDANALCTNINYPTGCPPSTPQELRFCVKVLWGGLVPGDVDLCSVLTNFQE